MRNSTGVLALFLASIHLAGAGPVKIRVNDPSATQSLLAQGARLIADYGSFQLLEVESLPPAEPWAETVADYDVVRLNARPLNTRAATIQALRRPVPPFAGKRLHLVQFAGPVKVDWVEALEQTGVQLVCYIPYNAYLIYSGYPALTRMQAWANSTTHVQWEAGYADEFKIHSRARRVDEQGNPRDLGTDTFTVQLLEDADANAATLALVEQLKLAPVLNQFHTLHYLNLVVRLPAGRLNEIAARPEVVSIQPYIEPRMRDERQDQILAGNLSGNLPSAPGYLAWLTSKGFTQAQFTSSAFAVDVSDSGIDNATTTPGHFGLYELGNPVLSSRVVYNRLEGTPHAGSTLQACNGHGNLNAHIIAGYNNHPSGFPHTDFTGYRYGLGVCPFVKVGSSVIFDPDTFTNPNFPNLQSRAYQDGARISANSWTANVAGDYDAQSQAYDALVRDAQPTGSTFPTAGNQQMVIVFAAGNAGSGAQTVGSPGSAKNIITVGASENVRSMSTANGGNNGSGNDGCATPDSGANNANDIADFSSRGPCADGRQKPELCAPGTHITGGVGQAGAATTNGTGTALACFDATGVCALPGGGTVGDPDNFFPLAQEFYTASTGTSHSTPAVAGACALLRQYFLNQSLPVPSPAMTKAFLVNSARYLNGVSANDNLWSPNQGMGAVNLGIAFDGVPRVLRDQLSTNKFTAAGQTRTFTGTIADPSKPYRVTLAWTDAPGGTTGDAFNNDLNLTVLVGGNTYKGNVFNGALSITGGVADSRNNLESVFLPAGLSGGFVVTVSAANINSDGVPNESPALDQDFGLVIYNANEAAIPLPLIESSAVTAESCAPANGAVDAGETVTMAFALKNGGVANTTNLVVTLLATNGVTSPSGPQAYGVLVPGGSAVTQSFAFTASGTCGGTINPVLQLQDGAANLGTLTKALVLGAQISSSSVATNSGSVDVPSTGKSGPGSPYPSTITVSGITGNVSKVTVTLVGVTHSFPDDIDALLVGPTGQKVMLMSDCGGDTDINGVTLTFDDAGPAALPDAATLSSGTFMPTDYDPGSDGFTAPAPAGPYGTFLSVFNGLNPNGTWSLYLRDDTFWAGTQNTGSIDQGWRLSITTASNVCCFSGGNTPPVVSSIPDVTTNENSLAGPVAFTIGDAETAASALTLAGTSSNTNLVPEVNISFAGSGSNRTVFVAPAANQFGTATITVRVSDGVLVASSSFLVTYTDVNQPPLLAPIADQSIVELETLTLTNSATDADLPPQTLTFSFSSPLDGAAIHPTTGVFTWTPTEFQGPATNVISVVVADNGFPSLSATQTFTVSVLETNSAPTLAVIPDWVVHAGSVIQFTNSASDADWPANGLSFALEAGGPPAASVNPTNGVFVWPTMDADTGTTNDFTVLVTDDGSPALNASRTFTAAVLARPVIQGIAVSNEVVTLTWSAIAGRRYQLQINSAMTSLAWGDVGAEVVASGATAVGTDTVGDSERFYRVRVVP